jgi:transcriptional regulator with XRE-family HTH domain
MKRKKKSSPPQSSRDMVPGLGAAMRAERDRLGLTLGEIAGWIGTSPAALSKVELGQRAPSARLLVAWARACGVSLDGLIGGLTE